VGKEAGIATVVAMQGIMVGNHFFGFFFGGQARSLSECTVSW
jgi:hypothetical protein